MKMLPSRGLNLLRSNEGVSTYDLYTTPVDPGTWDVPASGAARFSWEYEDGRQRLLDLYQRGKDKQWDATKRIDWDLPVNPSNVIAERVEREHAAEFAARKAEVDAAITAAEE
jgi:hypothetical protein